VCDAAPTKAPVPGADAGAGGGGGSAGSGDAASPPACGTIGVSCTSSATCCSGLCLGAFCDLPPP
jgi:hypothetical protein